MPNKIRSQDVTEGPTRAGARAMLRAVGLTDEDFAKPQIGVVSAGNEVTPCNLTGPGPGESGKARSESDRWCRARVHHHCRLRRYFDGA